ncbi:hypothetical protein HPP92_021151 [Vanilla planifolia]|uniref:Peptidase S9 prolyl oligopeptidase catalytic domain-containing protein n=1 Tax=Vanilla planifolia TaxID=51239 RepID=A0A835Q1T1_VANPL|nr:hypothetical protein HPP92_021151 [Vanilla planifolia]
MVLLFPRGPHIPHIAGLKELGGALDDRPRGSPRRRQMGDNDASKLRSNFLQVLRSRRRPIPDDRVPVETGKPVHNPMYQGNFVLGSTKVMESCPKANIDGLKDQLVQENIYLITEEDEQGRLPVLLLSLKQSTKTKRPVVVFIHSSYKCKEWLYPLLEAYASRGYISIAIDSGYHGERASNATTYQEALISSWKKGDTMPFIFDTVWDLIKLADYLVQRGDVDSSRIGITGESLGGLIRYAVVAPIIGVQGFRWAIDNDKWHARVGSIKPLFEEARVDLSKVEINREVVEKVWDRIAPGLASQFDSPYTVPAIAPRPQLIINGAEDPRCPLAGLHVPISRAQEAYEKAGCPEHFQFIAERGIEHEMTPPMVKAASDWFDKFLKP